VAKLIAHHLFLTSEQKDLLSAACLLHHRRIGARTPEGIDRLLTDIVGPSLIVNDPAWAMVRGILNAHETPGRGTAFETHLAGILRLADALDQNLEAQAIDGASILEILDRLRDGVDAGLWPPESLQALVESTTPPDLGEPESWRVPVFPQAAMHALRLMRDPHAKLTDVAHAASQDPAIAGLVMQLANSALFGSRTHISTLPQAICRLGFAASQKVIASAALRPLFSSPALQEVWRHSLQVADLAEQLSSRARTSDPAESYLAGLLHDVGRLALLSLPLYDSARLHGLIKGGCPPVYAESLLLRTDHAELGARIATGWRLPEHMISAIRQHHHSAAPESSLGHLLYVAEFLSGSEEDLPSDLPSLIRLEASRKGIGLSWDAIGDCTVSALGCWLAAA
jgi:putative nucleotidyltransferase with HDIG domain